MIISHKFETVFLHIPKNAGTSLRELVRLADPESEAYWGYGFLPRHYRFGDSAHIPLVDLAPERLRAVNRYSCFAVLRDPLDRFASACRQHMSQHNYREPRTPSQLLAEIDSIRIRYDPAYVHFCPQHYFTHIGDRQLVKTLFRFEDPEMQQKVGAFLSGRGMQIDSDQLNMRNISGADKPELGDEFDLVRFYQLYKRDYELFGFEPPVPARDFEIDVDAQVGLAKPVDMSAYDRLHFLNWNFTRAK